jgi:hypothetical protein
MLFGPSGAKSKCPSNCQTRSTRWPGCEAARGVPQIVEERPELELAANRAHRRSRTKVGYLHSATKTQIGQDQIFERLPGGRDYLFSRSRSGKRLFGAATLLQCGRPPVHLRMILGLDNEFIRQN